MNASEDSQPVAAAPTRRTMPPHAGTRWCWYHYYLLLALFDVFVIVASLMVYHRTVESYRVALKELGTVDDKLRWVADLRRAVVRVNAPGNGVFASGKIAFERERYERRLGKLRKVLQRQADSDVDLRDFREHVDEMIDYEEKVFEAVEALQDAERTNGEDTGDLKRATVLMAGMDRNQAKALGTLEEIGETLAMRRHELLRTYGRDLEKSGTIERYLFGAVFLILIAAYFFARKLQSTHERMLDEQDRLVRERHARLAEIGEVCAGVAHGIRNPLAGIMSSAQLALECGDRKEKTIELLGDVISESRRLEQRVDRLLRFSSVSHRALEPCSLSEIVRGALGELGPKINQAGASLSARYDEGRLVVEGDREALAQCIIELVSNSIDHLDRGGNVRVECGADERDPSFARIDVIDDGPGIPASIRPRVFDLFFTSRANGNGIGLASVKRTVEYHRGRVEVLSSNADGAHFAILLPMSSD